MSNRIKKAILLVFSVFIFGFLFVLINTYQKSIDNCYITLSEDEIKTISAAEFLKRPWEAAELNNLSVDQFKKLAQWIIVTREPTPRSEAASDYDMTLYEVRLEIKDIEYSVFIGKCKNIIAAGR